MAGRKLRQQRQERIANLSDEQAVELAQRAIRQVGDGQALAILAAKPGTDPRDILRTPRSDTRDHIADQITDPTHARLVLDACSHLAVVEQGIGLVRTPGQQRR